MRHISELGRNFAIIFVLEEKEQKKRRKKFVLRGQQHSTESHRKSLSLQCDTIIEFENSPSLI